MVVAAVGAAVAVSSPAALNEVSEQILGRSDVPAIPIPRVKPLSIEPLYNRPDLVSDDNLLSVLKQIQPRFDRTRLKPNHVEHALRTWGLEASFSDPEVLSGREMAEFLTDTGKYIESWGKTVQPLLQEERAGISVRWGPREVGGSVHHDHWLACLTEAGAPLDMPVYGPSRQGDTLGDVLQQSLRDFRLDERETEWTAMAFGFWLPPTKRWTGAESRHYSFDLLARRLLRGQKELGVCSGTHRVYSLVVLLRLDDEFNLLSSRVRGEMTEYLMHVREAIVGSQFEDGHWPSNWPDGVDAVTNPIGDPLFKQVIATGHHLEWLAIAPRKFHPPDEQIKKATDWVIDVTSRQSQAEILQRYTFFSHVGSALALWRHTHPAVFWKEHSRNVETGNARK